MQSQIHVKKPTSRLTRAISVTNVTLDIVYIYNTCMSLVKNKGANITRITFRRDAGVRDVIFVDDDFRDYVVEADMVTYIDISNNHYFTACASTSGAAVPIGAIKNTEGKVVALFDLIHITEISVLSPNAVIAFPSNMSQIVIDGPRLDAPSVDNGDELRRLSSTLAFDIAKQAITPENATLLDVELKSNCTHVALFPSPSTPPDIIKNGTLSDIVLGSAQYIVFQCAPLGVSHFVRDDFNEEWSIPVIINGEVVNVMSRMLPVALNKDDDGEYHYIGMPNYNVNINTASVISNHAHQLEVDEVGIPNKLLKNVLSIFNNTTFVLPDICDNGNTLRPISVPAKSKLM